MSLAVTRNMIGLLRPYSHSFYQHSRSLPTHTKTGALRGSSNTSDQLIGRSLSDLKLYQHSTSSLDFNTGKGYGSGTSFYVRAVLIHFDELDVSNHSHNPTIGPGINIVEVDLARRDHLTNAFKKINLRGTVPVLSVDGEKITQSDEIVRFLVQEKFQLNNGAQELFFSPFRNMDQQLDRIYGSMVSFTNEKQSQNVPAVLNNVAKCMQQDISQKVRTEYTKNNLQAYCDGMEEYLDQLLDVFNKGQNYFCEFDHYHFRDNLLKQIAKSQLGFKFFGLMLHTERYAMDLTNFPKVKYLFTYLSENGVYKKARAENVKGMSQSFFDFVSK